MWATLRVRYEHRVATICVKGEPGCLSFVTIHRGVVTETVLFGP